MAAMIRSYTVYRTLKHDDLLGLVERSDRSTQVLSLG